MASTGGFLQGMFRRRWLRRLAIGAVAGVALVTLLGFVVAPPIARHVAEKQLGQLLGRKVGIGRIRLNPFALSLAIEDFQIFEPDGTTPFFGFSRLYVNAQISSVFRRAPVIQEIALDSLRLHVVRTKATADAWGDVGGAYNFSDIVARIAAMPKSPEPPSPPSTAPPRFSLNNIHISDGALTFDDRPSGDHHEVTGLAIGVPFVSTLPVYLDSFVEPGLQVAIDGTPFAIHGRTKPFRESLETVLELRLNALDLTRYLPFVPVRLPFAVESGRLSLALDVGFARAPEGAPQLTVKGDIALEKLNVQEKHKTGTKPLCTLDRFDVKIGESDLTAQRFHVENILIAGLELHVRKERNGNLNLANMANMMTSAPEPAERATPSASPKAPTKATTKATSKAKESEPGPLFTVDRFTLEKTDVHFRDDSVDPPFATDVRDITVSVRGLSNARGVTATVEAGLRAVPGGTVKQHGTLRLTPLEARGQLIVDGVELARFSPYYQSLVAFDIGSGELRLGAKYHFEQEHTRAVVRVNEAFVDLDGLALRRRGARDDFFRLAALGVHGAALDLDAHTVNVAEITTHEGRLRAGRDAHGVVDLSTLVAAPPTAAAPAPMPPARPPETPATAEPPPSWTVSVARFDLDRWGVRFEDHAVTPAAVLAVDPIALHVTDLSTAPGAKLGLDLRVGLNKTGRIQVTGTTTLPPVTANLRFDLRALEVLPFQPYFRDQVSLTVTGGTIGIKGQAAVKVGTAPLPQMNVSADIDVNDLATVDRNTGEPLLSWRAFHVGALHVATPPMAVSIGDVSLADFQSRVVLLSDGGINLQSAFAPGAPAPAPTAANRTPPPAKSVAAKSPGTTTTATVPTAATADAPMPIAIGRLVLQGGQVSFSDRSIRPAYSAEVTDLSGRITGLSSVAGTTADVDVHGSINRSGALTIAGKVNPLAKDIALDVQVSLKDIELPPASPYTGKFAGYAIDKGKLDLALTYKIANRKLDAQNKLVLDQFTFGDKIDSPDAVKLPVRLAVALLKDRRGVIDIDLPIAGSLDDPEFKVWGAVLKVLGNLVVKAVTAPFSLIASAFGGGDELSRIDFAAGAAVLDGTAQKRLATLGRALRERPGISFEIEGGADPKQDREGLRRFVYERKLKAKKLAALVQGGAAVSSVDDLQIDPAERASLLEAAFKAETFPKPKNSVGLEKALSPAEMENLMLSNTRVEDDDLKALALRRATVVQSTLAKAVPGGASRLFLVTPRIAGPGGHAEFKLKKD